MEENIRNWLCMERNIRFVSLLILLSMTACTPLILSTMGMKNPRIITEDEMYTFGRKWNMSIYFQQTLLLSFVDEIEKIDF
mgnify:FL=1